MTGQMRTGPAARDADFRGIDPPALNHLIRQMQDADNAIRGWLNGHRPPPGVPATGYREAQRVAEWTAGQLGMLTRRYNYAITHPDRGGGVEAPAVPVLPGTPGTPGNRSPGDASPGNGSPSPGPKPVEAPARPRPVTPVGAGGDLGNFPTRQDAAKAARTDALAVAAAVQDRDPVPKAVWERLRANAGDPDYTEKLYERLGPAAAADLLKAAGGDEARLAAVRESLGTASHHAAMDVRWLRAFLAQADHAEIRPVAVQVLAGAPLSERTREALNRLGLDRKAG
ncbi:hypothetical protein [Actinomadura sp. 21ATH]|uniref:hypothetical protein n=1 Tax=Actinomadura sp. 21ATH TaxID=1735444 RepID=UPI0035C07DBA